MTLSRKIGWSVAVLLIAADIVMQVQAGSAGDKDWLLLAARTWLGGRQIGVDILEVNPPLIIWLFALPVWISQHVPGLPDYKALIVIGLGCTALSVALSTRLIALHPAFAGDRRRQADFALLLVATLLFFDTQVYFFDRDHIMFVLIFPYIMRFIPAVARQKLSLKLRLAIALPAAIGFCIKPHALIVLGVLQLLFIIRERSWEILWSLENRFIYAAWAIYAWCVWQFAPQYIFVVAPMALETYSGFSRRINGLLFLSLAFISAGLTFVDFRPRYVSPYRREAYYFMGVCGAFLLYALLNNGWGYTYNLLLCMLLFTSGWMMWEFAWLKKEHEKIGLPWRQFLSGQRGCAANLALNAAYIVVCLATFFFAGSCDKYIECKQNKTYVGYLADNHIRSFSVIGMNLRRWSSAVRTTGAEWESRFNLLWMMPTLMKDLDQNTGRHQWIADYVGLAYAQDLDKWKPEVVFVDISDNAFGTAHPVDIIAYLSRVAAFTRAWAHYHYLSTLDNCALTVDEAPPEEKNAPPRKPESADCRFAVYRRAP